jgi:hypothetical protein
MRLLCSLLCLTGLCFACDHAPAPAAPTAATPSAPPDSPPVAAVATVATPSATATTTPTPAPASTCARGWIDGCGSCYPPCETDADCKVKGQTCQPIVCTHTLYGNGCLAPESSSTAGGGTDAGTTVAGAAPSNLECRAKTGNQIVELFVDWKDGNLSSGSLRTTPATGTPSKQAITAEMVKGLVVVHPAGNPRKTIATEQTDPSKSLQVGDYKQPWVACQ